MRETESIVGTFFDVGQNLEVVSEDINNLLRIIIDKTGTRLYFPLMQ